jgi:hypothetical protein
VKIVFTKAEVEDIILMHVRRKFGLNMDNGQVNLSSYMTDYCVVSQAEEPVKLVKNSHATDIEDTFGTAV